jgi:hypothetical protein
MVRRRRQFPCHRLYHLFNRSASSREGCRVVLGASWTGVGGWLVTALRKDK